MHSANKVFEHFKSEEGYVLKAYKDTKGFWTIGVGRKLPTGKDYSNYTINHTQTIAFFQEDLKKAIETAKRLFPKFDHFSNNAQLAIADMIFNLGEAGFKNFKQTIAYINAGNFQSASKEALYSKWAKIDVPNRAKRVAALLAT